MKKIQYGLPSSRWQSYLDKPNISLHINNCFKEKELDKKSVVKESLTTARDGKTYRTQNYNLDLIISVGCAFLFVWFLEKNKHRFKKSGELKINDNALVALALLVAQSDPDDKDLMVKLVMNLIRN